MLLLRIFSQYILHFFTDILFFITNKQTHLKLLDFTSHNVAVPICNALLAIKITVTQMNPLLKIVSVLRSNLEAFLYMFFPSLVKLPHLCVENE